MTPLDSLTPMPAPTTTPAGERILDAAAQLFYLRGINRTGVDLIADRADVTKRTLYQRFGSKDALVATYLQQRAHAWQTYLLDGLTTMPGVVEPGMPDESGVAERPPDAGIDDLYRLVRAWVESNPRGCAFVNAWVETVADDDHPALAVVRAEKAWMRGLLTLLANGDAHLAETLHLLYEGAQVSATIEDSPEPFDVACSASRRLMAPMVV